MRTFLYTFRSFHSFLLRVGYDRKIRQNCIAVSISFLMCAYVCSFLIQATHTKIRESAILMIFYYDYFHFYFLPLARGTNSTMLLCVSVCLCFVFIPGVLFFWSGFV